MAGSRKQSSYIKTVVPMKDYRLFMEMESGSSVTVDFSVKLHTIIFLSGIFNWSLLQYEIRGAGGRNAVSKRCNRQRLWYSLAGIFDWSTASIRRLGRRTAAADRERADGCGFTGIARNEKSVDLKDIRHLSIRRHLLCKRFYKRSIGIVGQQVPAS